MKNASITQIDALPPHMLFHLTGKLVLEILPMFSPQKITILIMSICHGLTVIGIYRLFLLKFPIVKSNRFIERIIPVLSICLTWVGPLSLLIGVSEMRWGSAFIYSQTFHNPTQIMLRPIVVWLMVALIPSLDGEENKQPIWHTIFVITIFVILMTLTKPVFTYIITPAYICLLILLLIQGNKVTPYQIIIATTLLISSILILGWQLFIFSGGLTNQGESEIIFAPFLLYSTYLYSVRALFATWFVSLVFPITVYIVFWRQAFKDSDLNLTWIAMIGSLLITILFVQYPNTQHGNFLWGTRIASLLLFVTSTIFLLERSLHIVTKWEKILVTICWFIFVLHIVNFVISQTIVLYRWL